MGPVRKWCLAAAAVALLVLAGCGGEEDGGAGSATGAGEHGAHAEQGGSAKARFSSSEATTVVRTTLRDFAFDGVSPSVKGPKVLFEATNQGPSSHELVVADEDGREVGAIPPFDRGLTKTLAVELEPGRYTTRCVVRLGNRTHAQLGMETSFTVE